MSRKEILTCELGTWTISDTPINPDEADKDCKCPNLKVFAQPSIDLACTTPVNKTTLDEGGKDYYILGEDGTQNTCVLFCDSISYGSLSCSAKDGRLGWWLNDANPISDSISFNFCLNTFK